MASQWKKRYQQKQQRRKVPSNRSALEEAEFFRKCNAELTERTRHLISALRSQWDIDVSWDGLRRFWVIELNENGRLKRDKACKSEAENDKLRELVRLMDERDVLLPCMFGCNADCRFYSGDTCRRIGTLMRELGINVDGVEE